MTPIGLFSRVAVALGVTAGAFAALGLRINASPSLPVGLYVATSSADANLAEFCPTGPFASLSMSRGYRDRGVCPDGGAPLLKPVVARHEDLVEVAAAGLSVNGRLLENTAPLSVDTKGRSLTPWPLGRYRVAPDEVWVASSYSRRSFDSRYFGPIPTRQIRSLVRPLATTP